MLQVTGRTQTLDDSSAGIFPTFPPLFQEDCFMLSKTVWLDIYAIWQVVKDSIDTPSDFLLFTIM